MRRTTKQPDGKSGSRGFSLLEVLIAMSIMSVGLLALAQMQVAAMKQNRSTTVRTDAISVGQDAMEKVVNSKWDDVPSLAGTETVERNGVQYTVTTALSAGPGGLTAASKVMVSVAWNDGKDHAFSLSTVKTQAEDPPKK
ncbi:MAG: prepilin-type N-terminal cleavage/methylation domain-containing protein [Thermodesulfobacteriota bacterium]